jgi:hypothetical protein
MEPTNEDRAEWAAEAVKAFARRTGQDKSGDLKHEPELVLADLLCDLMHYADRDRLNFYLALQNGQSNFREEKAGG